MKKLLAYKLLAILLLNILAIPAFTTSESESLQNSFGNKVYICFGENSFDVPIEEYENLFLKSYENNLYELSLSKNFEAQETSSFEYNYQKSSSVVTFLFERPDFSKSEITLFKAPRSPPKTFV